MKDFSHIRFKLYGSWFIYSTQACAMKCKLYSLPTKTKSFYLWWSAEDQVRRKAAASHICGNTTAGSCVSAWLTSQCLVCCRCSMVSNQCEDMDTDVTFHHKSKHTINPRYVIKPLIPPWTISTTELIHWNDVREGWWYTLCVFHFIKKSCFMDSFWINSSLFASIFI